MAGDPFHLEPMEGRRHVVLGHVTWVGGVDSFAACLSHLAIDHASLSGQSTVFSPNRDTSSVWALIARFPYIT